MSNFFVFFEPLYRIRTKPIERYVRVLILVDASGSMYERIAETTGLPVEFAYEHAISIAREIMLQILRRGVKLQGHLGFFSDKETNFTCGGTPCIKLRDYLRMTDKPYVDYLDLSYTTYADIARLEGLTIRTSTGGTNPNPIIEHLVQTYGKYQMHYIITDGYVPLIKTHETPTYVYIVAGGTTDVQFDDERFGHVIKTI